MLDLYSFRSRAILATMLIAGLTTGSARGAQVGDGDDEPNPRPAQGLLVENLEKQSSQVLSETQAMLESRLVMEIERLERSFRLTQPERSRLELAGRGDLKRAFDRIDAVRKRLAPAKTDLQKAQACVQEIESIRRQVSADLPDRGSMFAKTLARVLGDDRMATYREGLRESRRFRHRARVDMVVEVFDVATGCSDEQRERLTKLLLQETRLPSRLDDDEISVMLAQAARLPESKIRPIFDESQWRSVSRLLEELNANLKEELARTLFDDPDDAAGPVAARPGASATVKD